MPTVNLSFGKDQLTVSIPSEWLGLVAQLPPVQPVAEARKVIQAALEAPIGGPPLADLVRPGMRVAVIVDDVTRKTPVQLVLPLILDELHRAGLEPLAIKIVLALGGHRPMTRLEIVERLGAEVLGEYEIDNAISTDSSAMVYLGTASNGIPAWVKRTVVEADLRIGIGMITPHIEAGFTGGAKIILPGVCGAATVDAFHCASAFIPENQLGRIDAPLRRSLEGFVSQVVPLHFILNLVLTPSGEVYRAVAGHPIHAHRAGVEHAHMVYGLPIDHRYPVVIANCAPYDQDLWQSVKGILCGDLLVEDGGTLIVVTAAPEGKGIFPLLPGYVGRDPEALSSELCNGTAQDPKQAATGVMIARLRQRINLALVSSGLTPTDGVVMRIPFFTKIETALKQAVERLPVANRGGCLAILPQAGVLLPLLRP